MSTERDPDDYPPAVLKEADDASKAAYRDAVSAGSYPYNGVAKAAAASAAVLARYAVAKRSEVKAPPLRVFRFEDDAYQIDTAAEYADMAAGTYVRLSDGKIAESGDGGVTMIPAHLSTWATWFDVTLASAAHDYLTSWLDIEREWCGAANRGSDSAMDRTIAAQHAVKRIGEAYGWGELPGARLDDDFMVRVWADIEARLRGEPGSTQKP